MTLQPECDRSVQARLRCADFERVADGFVPSQGPAGVSVCTQRIPCSLPPAKLIAAIITVSIDTRSKPVIGAGWVWLSTPDARDGIV